MRRLAAALPVAAALLVGSLLLAFEILGSLSERAAASAERTPALSTESVARAEALLAQTAAWMVLPTPEPSQPEPVVTPATPEPIIPPTQEPTATPVPPTPTVVPPSLGRLIESPDGRVALAERFGADNLLFVPLPATDREPVRSRPDYWLVANRLTALYENFFSEHQVLGVPLGSVYRLQGSALNGRYFVHNAAADVRGWIPESAVERWEEQPTLEKIRERFAPPAPRSYLYRRWPQAAPRMDCVIWFESRWDPNALNPSSSASGLAQFIPSTWARTPQGRAGYSPFDPYAAIDAFGWMVVEGGGSWQEWEVVLVGFC